MFHPLLWQYIMAGAKFREQNVSQPLPAVCWQSQLCGKDPYPVRQAMRKCPARLVSNHLPNAAAPCANVTTHYFLETFLSFSCMRMFQALEGHQGLESQMPAIVTNEKAWKCLIVQFYEWFLSIYFASKLY